MGLDFDRYEDPFLNKWNKQAQMFRSMDANAMQDPEERELLLCNTCKSLSTASEYPGQNVNEATCDQVKQTLQMTYERSKHTWEKQAEVCNTNNAYRGGGRGDQNETRNCFNCGKKDHLSYACRSCKKKYNESEHEDHGQNDNDKNLLGTNKQAISNGFLMSRKLRNLIRTRTRK